MDYNINFDNFFTTYQPTVETVDNDLDFDNVYYDPFGSRTLVFTDMTNNDYALQDNTSMFDRIFGNTTRSTSHNTKSQVNTSNLLSAINSHLNEIYSLDKRLSPGYSDCSGFVCKVYKDLGIDLKGYTSVGMWNDSDMIKHIDLNEVQPGDLVFLTPTSGSRAVDKSGYKRVSGKDPSHVAIVIEKNGTRLKIAEQQGRRRGAGKAVLTWYEVGNPNLKESGVINYSRGSGQPNTVLGYGKVIKK